MVLGWNSWKIVKKKFYLSSEDKKEWLDFTRNPSKIYPKENDHLKKYEKVSIEKLDLHGFTLDEANKTVKKFIIKSFNKRKRKILVVTGKGLRSKSYENPYSSRELSMLKNSVPEYIRSDSDLINLVSKTSKANLDDGGEGAIYIFLKKNYSKE